ncbi:tRNA (mnm(5)s(2)U34)-methyltransferase, chloroplastic isoform X2 [Silene latifolia]|uniref:tRNA (mnm(5)s(2)U34)-methyltransferase, chloroplastic isoform X2 n=1 Tax=Silene latifolia TaxID=37657 RepID=UPI003D7837CE
MSLCFGLALLKPRTSLCLQLGNNHVNFVKASSRSICSLSGLDSAIKGYIFGENKATQVAHLLWKQVVKKGDIVVDATCGNGYDTLALAKLVIDDTAQGGCVYGLDLQQDAINTTSHLIESSLNPLQRKSVKLFLSCHSKMAQLLPENTSVRLVSFNLGYLPGGDKKIITKSDTTLQALKAAKELLLPGGVISVVAYVGHPGGREEYEIVQGFASGLPPETWSCSQIQMLNKSSAPILVFLFKR